MDPIKMLKDDHEKVKGIFREYEKEKDGNDNPTAKQRIAERAFAELTVHSEIEEQIFYPAVKAAADEQGKELVVEGVEEHHVVKELIEEIKACKPQDEQYDAKFKVLTENVEHHIEEEEGEMFPDAKKTLGDKLESIGDQMMQLKQRLTSQAA